MTRCLQECETHWADLWRPRTKLGIVEWAVENIKPPNSARANAFDIDATPWLRVPAEAAVDDETRELVCLFPTGGSKTTLLDVKVPYSLTEESGSILVSMQSDPDADAYFDERLEPICLSIEKLRAKFESLPRNKRRKGEIIWPDRTLYVKGRGITAFQRKSVRLVALDEVWGLPHGRLEEARARTHNRWNRLVMILSQGGMEKLISPEGKRIDTELHAAWRRSTQEEYTMICPQCSAHSRWKLGNLKWASQTREDGSFDESALVQSVRYYCLHCKEAFEDLPATRTRLALDSIYITDNGNYTPHPHGHHRGFHAPCVALPHESWADIALRWTMATHAWKQGDREPRKIFIQKRLAENFREEDEAELTALHLSQYRKSEYIDGQAWDGELTRFMTIDVQKDHFWAAIRAWRADGASRLLWEGKLLTWEQLRDHQTLYNVKDFDVFCDSRYKQSEVEQHCAHWKWFALEGTADSGFTHYPPRGEAIRKYYSPLVRVHITGPNGENEICLKVRWSNTRIKDILVNLRGGHGAEYGIPADVSEAYKRQMISEIKRPILVGKEKRVVERYVVIGDRDNHLWDAEAMQVVGACIKRILRATVEDVRDPVDTLPASNAG